MVGTLRLSRSQIAQIVGNDPEAIRQFENLFAFQETAINDAQSLSINVGAADNKANEALAQLQRIADALDVVANAPAIRADNAVATDYIDFHLTPPHNNIIGRMNWNDSDRTIEVGLDYDVMQQVGLETYTRVQNVTGVTIPNGSAVGFVGAGIAGEVQAAPFIADGSQNSLYIIGVMTHDLPDSGETGYCTILGKVRGLDTSAWAVGDVLYCSPTTAGALTNVKPTAPDNVIPIAAVLVSDATEGVINVRPVIEQQKNYGEFTNTTTIVPAAANTAYAMALPNTEIALGVSIASTSRIVMERAGLYQFITRVQFSATNANLKSAWLWYRLNGTTDYTRSSVISTLAQNGGYRTLSASEFFTLEAGDYIEIMWAVDDVGLNPTNVAATAFSPSSPTARVSVTQVQQ